MDNYEMLVNSNVLYLDANALPKIDNLDNNVGFAEEGRIIRILIYLSTIPVYTSFVGFGEFFNVIGKKKTQKIIGTEGYLFICRQLMIDFDKHKIHRVEPIEDKLQFIRLSKKLLPKYGNLGGGDVWHLMSAIELKSKFPSTTFVSFEPKLVNAALSENINAIDGNKIDSNLLSQKLRSVNKIVG